MEQRRLQITRRTDQAARAIIADIMKKSITDIRGDYPDEILQVVNNFSFDFTHIPETGLEYSSLFQDKYINNLLELIYLDLLVQYSDIFDFQDHLRRIRKEFEASIGANVVKASEVLSKAQEYRELSSRRYEFTDVIHESFNTARNQSTAEFPLSVNNGAGILKLGGTAEEYAKPETSNVYLSVQSDNAVLLDESESSSAYPNDITDPFFVTVTTAGAPDNSITEDWDFPGNGYAGLIVDLVVRFNTMQPVTRVCFTPFSTKAIGIPCVFHSAFMNAKWDSGEMIHVKDLSITYDTNTVEINFERVFAREIHILLHQDHYNLARVDTEIEDTLSASEYIATVRENLSDLLPQGFVEPIYPSVQISELVGEIRNKAMVRTSKLSPNTRVYTVGLCGLSVSNISYSNYGEYKDRIRPLNGTLHSVSFAQTDNSEEVTEISNSGVVDMCSVLSIQAGEDTIYLGDVDESGCVMDGCIVEANLEYSSGTLIRSTSMPYKIKTHFLPTDDFDSFKMFADGETLQLTSGAETEISDYYATIRLPYNISDAYNLSEGAVVTLSYAVPDTDYYGNPYSVREVNIEERIGRPNIAVNEAFNITDNYLYIPVLSGSLSYAEDEYTKVLLSGEIYYQMEDDKGLEIDGEFVLQNGFSYYVHSSYTSGPFDSFYYGSLKEDTPEFIESGAIGGTWYNFYRTEEPYIKGTMSVFSGDRIISELIEYDTDTVGDVLTDSEKREFAVPVDYDSGSVIMCYIPIDPTATTDHISSNIAQYNATEKFSRTKEMKISLSKYPHLDYTILLSDAFDLSDGAFYLKWKYSVVYEPIAVYVNGIKAVNITKYREDINSRPTFRKSYREDDYQFYVEKGKTLVFNKDLAGTIMVYYYKAVDTIQTGVEMYRSTYSRDDLSPEIYSYTILANIQG